MTWTALRARCGITTPVDVHRSPLKARLAANVGNGIIRQTPNLPVVNKKKLSTIGWREWVSMPEFGVTEIKAKVDTGADNSSLHAFNLERFQEDGVEMVRFEIHPRQRKRKPSIECVAPVAMERKVKNPGGRSELRPVIKTTLIVADEEVEALVNLTTRDEMTFRMLLGRRTVRNHFVIDPGRSYVGERPSRKATE